MKLHIIGTGGPVPSAKRFGSAFLLETGKDFILVDCGPATTYKMTLMGFSPTQVEYVFLTHHHSDHNVDFPCFSLARFDLDDGKLPYLKVFGPDPTEEFVERLLGEKGAFSPDISARRNHPVSKLVHKRRGGKLPRPDIKVKAKNIDSGKIVETDSWKASCIRVQHVEPNLTSLAYRFDRDEGSIVFAGDCAECGALIELSTGADTLVTGGGPVGTDRPVEIKNVCAGAPEVADMAQRAGVSRVILTHNNSVSPDKKKEGIGQVKEKFSGTVLFPEELETIQL